VRTETPSFCHHDIIDPQFVGLKLTGQTGKIASGGAI
jgi:hypothetical protein